DYAAGSTAVITRAGFRPAEVVSIRVEHSNGLTGGANHLPFSVVADADGHINTTWVVNPADSRGKIFRLAAPGVNSGLIATTTLTDDLITVIDDNGPDDQPGQKDLTQMSFNPGATAIAITWNWDDTDFGAIGGNTGDACGLIDTDKDGFANYSFCV